MSYCTSSRGASVAATLCPRCRAEFAAYRHPLTKRQAEVLAFIRHYIADHGYAPNYEEIATAFGYNSLSTVHEHLNNLDRKGYITRRYNEARSISLVDAPAEVAS